MVANDAEYNIQHSWHSNDIRPPYFTPSILRFTLRDDICTVLCEYLRPNRFRGAIAFAAVTLRDNELGNDRII